MFGLGFLDAIGTIISKIVSGIVDVVVFLFTHPLFLLALIVGIVGLYYYITISHHIHVLEAQIVEYNKERIVWVQSKAIYEANTRLITEINKENQKTLNTLTVVNQAAIKAKVDLQKAINASNARIGKLEDYINKSSAADNGPVAPVLKKTITEIDAERKERNGLWSTTK